MAANNLFHKSGGGNYKQTYSDIQLKVVQIGHNIGRIIGDTYECYSYWWNEVVPEGTPNPEQKLGRLIKLGSTKDKNALIIKVMDFVLKGEYIPNPTGKGFGTMKYDWMSQFSNLVARWDAMRPTRLGLVNWIDRSDSIYHNQTKASKKLIQSPKALGIGGGIIKGIGAVLQQKEAQYPNIDMYDINIYKQKTGPRPVDIMYMVMPTDNNVPLTEEEKNYKLFTFEDELSITPNISILETMYSDLIEVDKSFNTKYLEEFYADIQSTIDKMTNETNKKILEIRLMRAKNGTPIKDYTELSKIIEGVKSQVAGSPIPQQIPVQASPQNNLFVKPEVPEAAPVVVQQPIIQQPAVQQPIQVTPPIQQPVDSNSTISCPICVSDIPKDSQICPKCKCKLK